MFVPPPAIDVSHCRLRVMAWSPPLAAPAASRSSPPCGGPPNYEILAPFYSAASADISGVLLNYHRIGLPILLPCCRFKGSSDLDQKEEQQGSKYGTSSTSCLEPSFKIRKDLRTPPCWDSEGAGPPQKQERRARRGFGSVPPPRAARPSSQGLGDGGDELCNCLSKCIECHGNTPSCGRR